MKNFYTPFKLTMLLALVVLFQSCSDTLTNEDLYNGTLTKNISEFVLESPEHSKFTEAASRAGVLSLLEEAQNVQAFLPNNTAMDAYLQAHNYTSVNDVPQSLLKQLVLNHVLTTTIDFEGMENNSETFVTTRATDLFDNTNLHAIVTRKNSRNTVNGVVITGEAQVFTNGSAHILEQVIEPSTIGMILKQCDAFKKVREMLADSVNGDIMNATLESSTVDALTSNPTTFLLPNSSVIDAFLASSIDGTPAASRNRQMLESHIALQKNLFQTKFENGMQFQTLLQDITTTVAADGSINLSSGPFGSTVNVANDGLAHIQTANGSIVTINGSLYAY